MLITTNPLIWDHFGNPIFMGKYACMKIQYTF